MAKKRPPTRSSRPKSAGRKGAAGRSRSASSKAGGAKKRTPKRKAPAKAIGKTTASRGPAKGKKPAKSKSRPAARPAVKAKSRAGGSASSSARVGRKATASAARGLAPRRTTQQRGRLESLEEPLVPTPPSSLDPNRPRASAARTGSRALRDHLLEHTETGPAITGGDVDADWETASSSGDEAPGGDNPTPDQDIVDDLGKALGVEYQDNEELKGAVKLEERDRHRWELDPASSEDYPDRTRKRGTKEDE